MTLPLAEMQTFLFMKNWTTFFSGTFYVSLRKKFFWGKTEENISRKAELKQRVKVNLAIHVGMFRKVTTIYNLFSHTGNYIFFRIPENQSILNTPLWCLNLSFSIEGLHNINCLQGKERRSW